MTVDDFASAPSRIAGEREERLRNAERALRYHHPFLDDVLRGILPHDFVLLGARSGAGKSDLALAIAVANARAGKRPHVFVLEAEPLEAERRIKFSLIVELAAKANHPFAADLNFADWMFGRCEHVAGDFDAEAERVFSDQLVNLFTCYRGARFDQAVLRKSITSIASNTDLLVIDHLHFVDTDPDDSENRALGETTKTIRNVALEVGKPTIVVAHLRKRERLGKQIVPSLDDFHGTSNIAKQATHAIMIEHASGFETPWYISPTFISVPKDRRLGAQPLVALCNFDRRFRAYAPTYTLGRIVDGGTKWEALKLAEAPRWARGHRPEPSP